MIGVWVVCTLRASLSGIFLQTLPDVVTPQKGPSIFISAQLSTDAVSALLKVWITLRAPSRKDVVNQCLEFGFG